MELSKRPPYVLRSKHLRRGKWDEKEEIYTATIISCFRKGLLFLDHGITLRQYLANALHCDPMRITKKFAGDQSIGKCSFAPISMNVLENDDDIEHAKESISKARDAWYDVLYEEEQEQISKKIEFLKAKRLTTNKIDYFSEASISNALHPYLNESDLDSLINWITKSSDSLENCVERHLLDTLITEGESILEVVRKQIQDKCTSIVSMKFDELSPAEVVDDAVKHEYSSITSNSGWTVNNDDGAVHDYIKYKYPSIESTKQLIVSPCMRTSISRSTYVTVSTYSYPPCTTTRMSVNCEQYHSNYHQQQQHPLPSNHPSSVSFDRPLPYFKVKRERSDGNNLINPLTAQPYQEPFPSHSLPPFDYHHSIPTTTTSSSSSSSSSRSSSSIPRNQPLPLVPPSSSNYYPIPYHYEYPPPTNYHPPPPPRFPHPSSSPSPLPPAYIYNYQPPYSYQHNNNMNHHYENHNHHRHHPSHPTTMTFPPVSDFSHNNNNNDNIMMKANNHYYYDSSQQYPHQWLPLSMTSSSPSTTNVPNSTAISTTSTTTSNYCPMSSSSQINSNNNSYSNYECNSNNNRKTHEIAVNNNSDSSSCSSYSSNSNNMMLSYEQNKRRKYENGNNNNSNILSNISEFETSTSTTTTNYNAPADPHQHHHPQYDYPIPTSQENHSSYYSNGYSYPATTTTTTSVTSYPTPTTASSSGSSSGNIFCNNISNNDDDDNNNRLTPLQLPTYSATASNNNPTSTITKPSSDDVGSNNNRYYSNYHQYYSSSQPSSSLTPYSPYSHHPPIQSHHPPIPIQSQTQQYYSSESSLDSLTSNNETKTSCSTQSYSWPAPLLGTTSSTSSTPHHPYQRRPFHEAVEMYTDHYTEDCSVSSMQSDEDEDEDEVATTPEIGDDEEAISYFAHCRILVDTLQKVVDAEEHDVLSAILSLNNKSHFG